jgi:hypothetical protein
MVLRNVGTAIAVLVGFFRDAESLARRATGVKPKSRTGPLPYNRSWQFGIHSPRGATAMVASYEIRSTSHGVRSHRCEKSY